MDKYLFSYATASDPPIKRGLIRLVEKATGQPKLKRMYVHNQRFPRLGETFWQAAVRSLELDVRYDAHALAAVPKTGPVVFVANHPYGVLDGIVMAWLVSKARPDFLVLTHVVLTRAPEAAPFILPIDFSGAEGAEETNLASRAAARDHLARRRCGRVSSRRHFNDAGQVWFGARSRRALAPLRLAAYPAFEGQRYANLVRRPEQPPLPDRQSREPHASPLADLP